MNVIYIDRSARDVRGWDAEMQSVMARLEPQYRPVVMALARELAARHPAQPAPRALRLVQG